MPLRVALTLLLLVVGAAAVAATPQPTVAVVSSAVTGDPVIDALRTAVVAQLREDAGYALTVFSSEELPETLSRGLTTDAAVFVRQSPRRDGRARVEIDVWARGRGFTWSQEYERGTDAALIADALRVAATAGGQVVEALGAMGYLHFANTGAPLSYYIYLNGQYLGADLLFSAVRPGSYTVEIRGRDGEYEHTLARDSLTVRDGEALRLSFRLPERLPEAAAGRRRVSAMNRWLIGFGLSGELWVSLESEEERQRMGRDNEHQLGLNAAVQFNDVLIRGGVAAIEVIQLQYRSGRVDVLEYRRDSLLFVPTIGLIAGPVFGFDFTVRGGLGPALSRAPNEPDMNLNVARAVAELGLGIGRMGRLKLGATYHLIFNSRFRSDWIGLQVGLGGRF